MKKLEMLKQLNLQEVSLNGKSYYVESEKGKVKPTIECFVRDEIRFLKRAISRLKGYKEYWKENSFESGIKNLSNKKKHLELILRHIK